MNFVCTGFGWGMGVRILTKGKSLLKFLENKVICLFIVQSNSSLSGGRKRWRRQAVNIHAEGRVGSLGKIS